MGRKNRRRGGKALPEDLIEVILAESKSNGLRVDVVTVEDPLSPSAADQAYYNAVRTCDRIIAELDQELRSDHHVRSRKSAGSCDQIQS